MKNVNSIIRNEEFLSSRKYRIANNRITEVDIKIIAHFGNVPCFTIVCENIVPFSLYNNISNLGYLTKAFVELFEVDREDGVFLSDLKNIPCRLVFPDNNTDNFGCKCIGIGHFMKDKFVLFEDFSRLGVENK